MARFLFIILLLGSMISTASADNDPARQAAVIVFNQLTNEEKAKDPEICGGSIGGNRWLITVDYEPNSNWGHKVYYYIVEPSSANGTLTIRTRLERHFMPSIPMSKIDIRHNSPTRYNRIQRKRVTKRDIPSSTNQYAIILSGGWDKYNNHVRYWNDCSYIYSVLRDYYNVPANNIFASMSDGTDPKPDLTTNESQPLDLDGDGINDIEYSASLSDLEAIFTQLKDTLTSNDHLFLFVIDHGDYDSELQSSYICLWNGEKLYPTKLNEWLTNLNVGSINCVFGQCFSGGFINELSGSNRIIATACKENEYSYASADFQHDSFVEAWTTGLMNPTKYNGKEVECADYNGDEFINMDEAFYFAYYNDDMSPEGEARETPQFDAYNYRLARNLCFDRLPAPFELVIRDDENDDGIVPNLSATINNSPDIWVRNKEDGLGNHQNPVFTTEGTEENFVYVTIHNMGLYDYIPGVSPRQYLHLNWSKGLPTATYGTFTGQYTDPVYGRIGSAIKSIYLKDEIPAGGEVTVSIPWKTHGYQSEFYGGPKSILATISNMPYGLAYDVTRGYYPEIKPSSSEGIYSRHNKGMAIKNLFYPNITEKKTWRSEISLQGLDTEKSHYSIRFQSGNSTKIFDKLKLTITLPQGTFATDTPDTDRSSTNQQRVVINPDSIYTFTSEDFKLQYIGLDARQVKTLSLKADIVDNTFTGPLSVIMSVEKYPEHEIVGTYTFNCSVNRGNFSTVRPRALNAIEEEDEDSDTSIRLSASKTSDRNMLIINLDKSCDEPMLVHVNSLSQTFLGNMVTVEPGQTEIAIPIKEFGDDIIIVSLEKNGEIISNTAIK